MSNPYEHRELWQAVVGYTDKTVEEVQAEHEQKHKDAEKKTKPGAKGPPVVGVAQPKQSEVDKLNALMSFGKQAKPQVNLDDVSTSE